MAAKTPRSKPQTTASPSVLKTGSCPSLTGASTLTYEIGTAAGGIAFRITGNSGGGLFGKEWVPWSALQPVLATDPVIHCRHAEASGGLLGQSPNPPGFLLVVLVEGPRTGEGPGGVGAFQRRSRRLSRRVRGAYRRATNN